MAVFSCMSSFLKRKMLDGYEDDGIIPGYSPWDLGQIGIKKGTICVIYHWKAYLLGIQKIYVGGVKVSFK